MTIRVLLVGYGLGGRVFHAPLLAADSAFSLDGVVTSNSSRAAEVVARYPNTEVLTSASAAFASGRFDLAVISTPPNTHYALAEAALSAGLHVVVDKPFVADPADGERLIEQATSAGRMLTVFHNRRWDSDFLTLRRVIESGDLGEVVEFESRWDRWRPAGLRSWKNDLSLAEGAGLLADLGSHMIDQAIQLFGPVEEFWGETARHAAGPGEADDSALVSLRHHSGVRSRVSATLFAALPSPRFRLLGTEAAFEKWGNDSQEASLAAGVDPSDPAYGVEPHETWGAIGTADSTKAVPAERGAYPEFYRGVAAAIAGGTPPPVDPADAVEVMRIIAGVHAQNRRA